MLQLGIKGLGIARFKFNPIAWFAKGEPGAWYDPSDISINWRRNLLTYTEDFSNGVWNKANFSTTEVTSGFTAPDNSLTAYKLYFYGTTGGDRIIQDSSLVVSSGIIVTGSIYLKADTACTIDLSIGRAGPADRESITCAVTTSWQRFTYTHTSTWTGATATRLDLSSISTIGYVYAWGAQLERSSSPSVYQKITDGVQDYYTYQPQPILFQDAAGTIPITYIEQPVGLMLDKSKGLALGAELVTNGDFNVDISGVTQIGGVGIIRDTSIFTTGGLKLTAIQPGNSGVYAQISIPTVVGATYSLSADLYAPATNSVSLSCFLTATNTAGTEGINISANGVVQRKTCIFSATSTTTFIKAYIMNHGVAYGTTGDVAYYDNISVKQIAGNHAFQATSGNKPLLSARVNLLTKTEDFSDAVWAKSNSTVTANTTTAPDGTLSADTCITTSNSIPSVRTDAVFIADTVCTFFVYIKATSQRYILVAIANGLNSVFVIVDTLNWVITDARKEGTGTYISHSLVPASNGYYKVTVTGVARAGVTGCSPQVRPCDTPTSVTHNVDITNSPTSYIFWGADLRPTNSGTLLPPYQRVNTSSDYDTVGFPLYLACNGTVSSRAMSTNSIDFTSTDKMTVVTGVRKLSDANYGAVIELSADATINNGSFYLFSPGTIASGNTNVVSRGTVLSGINDTSSVPPISRIATLTASISTPSLTYRLNGTQVGTSSANQGSGTYGNYPLYLFVRAGNQMWFNGNFYGAIIRGAQSDTASVVQTENYMATKTGITF